MKVAVIGCGNIARVHAPLILKHREVELVGVADKDLSRAKTMANGFNVSNIYDNAETMIDEQKPDVIHVLVPPQQHAEVSIMAMNRGCHVLVEKPMALSVAEGERMIAAAKQNKVSLCVDHNPLFDGVFRRAIQLSATGIIGDVVSVEAHEVYDLERESAFTAEGAEHRHWAYRTNGGPLQDMLPHPACLVLEFIPEIKEIHSVGHHRGVFPNGWQDELRVVVTSQNVIGYMHISASERPDACTLTIRGTKGTLHADSYNQVLTARTISSLPRKFRRGLDGFKLAGQSFTDTVTNMFKLAVGRLDLANGIDNLIAAFYESVQKGKEPPVLPESALRTIDLTAKVWPVPVANSK